MEIEKTIQDRNEGFEETHPIEVKIGSVVTLQFLDEPGEPVETFVIVGNALRNQGDLMQQPVSASSPLGKLLLGANQGDIKELDIQGFPENRICILGVENNP